MITNQNFVHGMHRHAQMLEDMRKRTFSLFNSKTLHAILNVNFNGYLNENISVSHTCLNQIHII